MSIIRWLALLPVVLLGKLATILCAPVAAYLSMRGDALPAWLRWMQTHDNPLDALWQQPAHMRGYATLIGVQPMWCAAAPLPSVDSGTAEQRIGRSRSGLVRGRSKRRSSILAPGISCASISAGNPFPACRA